jgi:16S rRNA (uracil1498-N3)-methyltransferase
MGHPELAPLLGTMTVPRFLVHTAALDAPRTTLTGTEFRHLRARRLRPGSAVIVCDAHGRQRRGVILAVQGGQATIELTDEAVIVRESRLRLVLAQALLKASKLDLVVEKATELGVSEIIIFNSARSIGHASAERVERWNRVARSAAKQSQRSVVPHVSGPVPLADALRRTHDAGLLFWERRPTGQSALAQLAVTPQHPREVLAVVGPEGGLSEDEAVQAAQQGFTHVSLGPRILRAETAAIAALTLCQFLWGDLSGR